MRMFSLRKLGLTAVVGGTALFGVGLACTSISTQYELKAIPAFVVDVRTESANQALDKAGYGGYGK